MKMAISLLLEKTNPVCNSIYRDAAGFSVFSLTDKRQRKTVVKKYHAMTHAVLCGRQIQAVRTGLSARKSILWLHFIDEQLVRQQEWKNHVIDKTNLMLVTRAF